VRRHHVEHAGQASGPSDRRRHREPEEQPDATSACTATASDARLRVHLFYRRHHLSRYSAEHRQPCTTVLPGRGYDIRIWPGRYPTTKSYRATARTSRRSFYRGSKPIRLQTGGGPTGDRGKAVDPVLLGEDILIKKEIDQGPAYFQLQHMLSTTLSDAMRFPLKLANLRVLALRPRADEGTYDDQLRSHRRCMITSASGLPIKDRLYRVKSAEDFGEISGWHMYVDPAGGGQNGDELAYAITGLCAGRVLLADVGGIHGGYDDLQLDWLTAAAVKWKPKHISIEKNFGNGALSAAWQPRLLKALRVVNHSVGIEDVWESGQKELRIIDVLEPMIGAGKFIVHEDLIRRTGSNARSTQPIYEHVQLAVADVAHHA
jgi:hypothetical protein